MLTESQRALLAARLRRGRADAAPGIPRRGAAAGAEGRTGAGAGVLPLSFGQEQLWFIDRFAPGLATYNHAGAVRLRGPLDAAALGRAVDALVARHEVLRTRLAGVDGRPAQVIDAPARAPLAVVDLAGLAPGARDAELRRLGGQEAARPFVLAQGPLFRARLVRLAQDHHVLLTCVHHAVFDSWSSAVLVGDLAALYEAEAASRPASLPELPVQFADYALWERERLQGDVLEELAGYWRKVLEGVATVQLPTDRRRPVLQSFDGGLETMEMGAAVLAGLTALSRQEGTTLFVTLLAALQVLLHRYTGQDDIVVGTVSANRGRPELAPLIGYLVNTLAIRTDMSGNPTFAELLRQVRMTTVEAYAHQDLPFAKLVDILQVDRDPSRPPLFQIAFALLEPSPGPVHGAGVDFELSDGYGEPNTAKSDLSFFASVDGDELTFIAEYATALFDGATVRRMLGNLRVLLAGVAADPSGRLSRLPVLSEAERQQEIAGWNDTAVEYPTGCVHEMFERQVKRTPDGVAAELDGASVSYAQLNMEANQVARRLRELGVGPEVLVGVSMAPSLRRLAALLGIMKAGGGYVPLDPDLPAARLSFMAGDAGMPVIVTDAAGEPGLPVTDAAVLSLDREWPVISGLNGRNPGWAVDPSNVAYVIYTSGSTGQPKGVVVEHAPVVNFIIGMTRHWPIGTGDRVLQFASLNFDVSVAEMFIPLLSGATAVLGTRETLLSPPRLADLMRGRRVTFTCLPPAVVTLLTGAQFPDLRVLMSAGDVLPPELVRSWLRPGLRFGNGYGPTEAAVGATLMELDGTVFPPPIGRPMPNYRAYVLDVYLNPVPLGVTGELHLGGPTLAREYLNQPELTARRFITDPFSDAAGARMYKTGDLVRRLPDGNIQFLGRIDGQVKIRGMRIELGEIEAVLASHPATAQAVVIVREDQAGQNHLVGYARTSPDGPAVSPADLRQHLAQRLPAYMVPSHIVILDAFPLNANRKIDRAALPAPGAAGGAARYVAPRTLLETMLTDMYAGLLNRGQVGIDDGFFDLGGNSLQAMALIARLRTDLAVDTGVTAVFLAPTPRQLAVRVEAAFGAARSARAGPLVELTDGDGARPLFVVHAVGGTVFGYALLAQELAGAFKVYGIEAAGLADGSTAAASLGTLVASYVDAVRAVQAEGPYLLAGWSMGGLVAYEIARQLEELGQDVALLALLDAPSCLPDEPSPPEPELAGLFVADACRTLGWASAGAPVPASSTAADQLAWLADRLDGGAGHVSSVRAQIERRYAVFRAHSEMIAGYRPRAVIHADALLVSAEDSPNDVAQWSRVLDGSIRSMTLPCDHYTLLRSAGGRQIAAAILDWK